MNDAKRTLDGEMAVATAARSAMGRESGIALARRGVDGAGRSGPAARHMTISPAPGVDG